MGVVSIPVPSGAAEKLNTVNGYIITDTTAGNLTLQWAQQVSDVADCTVKAGSSLLVWEV